MSTDKPHRNRLPKPSLSESNIDRLLAVHSLELDVRLKEVERDTASISLNRTLAQQSIEAQERDRKHAREEHTKRQQTQQRFVIWIVGGVLLFSAYAIYMGQSSLVFDFAKLIVGFVGGMGYAAYRRSRRNP